MAIVIKIKIKTQRFYNCHALSYHTIPLNIQLIVVPESNSLMGA